MLTIEYKINGILIGQIYAHNEGFNETFDKCTYKYHYYSTGGNNNEGLLINGRVDHFRKDGFEKLAFILGEEISNRLNEMEQE